MDEKKVYLDNGATTKVDKRVIESMLPYFNKIYGNPSSLHEFGMDANQVIEDTKEIIKKCINSNCRNESSCGDKLLFVGSGTEANNMAICSFAYANKSFGKHIITTRIEHNAILNPCQKLEREGFEVTYLDVNEKGFIDLKDLRENIRDDTILVSIIHSNHEIGTIQDLESIGKICKDKNVIFHTDAAQSFGKIEIDVKKFNLGMVSLNAHKIHGPKGIGALYVRKGILLKPLIVGGGQELGLRSGTENIPLIAGFSKTCEIAFSEMKENVSKMRELRDYMLSELLKIPHTKLNGTTGKSRICNNVSVVFDFVEGEALLLHLDLLGVAVSTGSACSSKSLKPSSILTAIGNNPQQCHGTLRFTLSKFTTKNEIDFAIDKVKKVVSNLRELSPLKSVEIDEREKR